MILNTLSLWMFFSFLFSAEPPSETSLERESLKTKIEQQISKQKTKNHLLCKSYSFPSGQEGQGANTITLSFQSNKSLELEEARALFIDVREDLLETFRDPSPLLIESPRIILSFNKEKCGVDPENLIALIFLEGEEICYCTFDQDSKDYLFYCTESYQEALNIIK